MAIGRSAVPNMTGKEPLRFRHEDLLSFGMLEKQNAYYKTAPAVLSINHAGLKQMLAAYLQLKHELEQPFLRHNSFSYGYSTPACIVIV